MRSHKYVKRTGGPGNYKYWYKMPDGRIVEGDQEKGKVEHARRLLAGRLAGHHAMTNAEIAQHTGYNTPNGVNSRLQQMKTKQRAGKPMHDFEGHHMHESKHSDVDSSEYAAKISRHLTGDTTTAPAAPAPESPRRGGVVESLSRLRATGAVAPRRPRAARRLPSESDASLTARRGAREREAAMSPAERATPPEGRAIGTPAPAASAAATAPARPAARRTPQIAAPAGSAPLGIRPAPAAERAAAGDSAARIRELRGKLSREHGVSLEAPAPSPAEARASATRIRAAKASLSSPASPTAPHAAPLHEADPAFKASEAPIKRMLESQARGGNPYLDRAKEIFNKIKSDPKLKPERKQAVEHMLAAIAEVGHSDEAALMRKYKELTGRSVRTLPKDDFERATAITLEEVMSNKPIDVEMERMKRGYGAKQFLRMKPFLKDSFTSRNPSAPPPYPTFGDIKSWTEHGGAKPAWAGTTRLAMPQEVHTAAVKDAAGKPLYPPAWMPIHLMPVWNYVAKSEGAAAYQVREPGIVNNQVQTGNVAEYQEGMIKAALRKYVNHRGEGNLVDIPASKLSEKGTSHAEIFKGDGDAKLKALMKTKIIDPVALMPFVQAEMKGVKKSFALVIDENLPAISFKKAFTVKLSIPDAIRARIEKVKAIYEKKSRS